MHNISKYYTFRKEYLPILLVIVGLAGTFISIFGDLVFVEVTAFSVKQIIQTKDIF